jgi:hypothetical protein
MADASLFDIFMATAATTEPVPDVAVAETTTTSVAIQEAPAATAPEVLETVELPPAEEAAGVDEVPKEEKKKRKPRSSKKGVKKTKTDKTAKESKHDSSAQPETRHSPGYSMLRVERDKIERSRLALVKKNETRAAQGKPAPTVCSILVDSLIDFYNEVQALYDTKFGKYLARSK